MKRFSPSLSSLKAYGTDGEKALSNAFKQDFEGAVIGQGDARLTETYAHLAVSPDNWRKMNPPARRKYLTKAKESGPLSSSSVSVTVSAKSCGITSIPHAILANQFSKADRLLRSNKVSSGFGASNSLFVASESSPAPHVITVYANGKFACDDKCPAYKHSKLCSHTLAAAEFSKKTDAFIKWYKSSCHGTSVTEMSAIGIDIKQSGRKPNQRKKGKSASRVPDFTVLHKDQIDVVSKQRTPQPQPIAIKIVKKDGNHQVVSNNPFTLAFLQDHPRVTTCCGCHSKFAKRGDGQPFPPPNDIVISHKECTTWHDKDNVLRMGKEQNAYFHVSIACIRKGNGKGNADFHSHQLEVNDIVKQRLV
ncbi:hypothetical protein AC249_AIPGENE27460 [Exaiptasia diaphana]|nr:hypothetical protein AC249_AIPGENE27460 [Exaiptasia diaphana]